MGNELVVKIGYNELVRLLNEVHKFEETVAYAVADYLTECIEYELDLDNYIWNTLLFNVVILDSKEEALKYIEENLCCNVDDCKIYETNNHKCYLEYP